MRNKHHGFLHPAAVFLLLTGLVAFFSWVGSTYGWEGVQSLLSPEGIRWRLRTLQSDYLASPFLGPVLLLGFGVGLCLHSGWWAQVRSLLLCQKRPSRKERRALTASVIVAGIYAALLVFLAVGPWSGMRTITGTLSHSPLADGLFPLLSLGIGNMAVVYAYVADYYNSERDIVRGMAYGFVRFSTYFVTLFFVVLFFTSFRYSGLASCLGLSDKGVDVLYVCCSLLLLYDDSTSSLGPSA